MAAQNRDAAIRDAFVAGLRSGYIRQRLLEDNVGEHQAAFDKARTLDEAQKNWRVSLVHPVKFLTFGRLRWCV